MPLNLNVASGIYVEKNYVNLDNSIFLFLSSIPFIGLLLGKHKGQIEGYKKAKKETKVIRCDCSKKLPFEDGTVDHIFCSHFIEHLYQDNAKEVLRDFYRLLKVGGTAHIIVPDIHLLASDYISGKMTADEFVSQTILARENHPSFILKTLIFLGFSGLNHNWMYDKKSLTKRLVEIGFTVLEENNTISKDLVRNEGIHLIVKK